MAAAIGLALAPWTVAAESLKDHVARQIKAGYGLDATFGGAAVVSLLPMPRVRLRAVTLSDRTGAIRVEAAQVKGGLRLLPLLAGHVRLADLSIASARISLVLDGTRDAATSVERLRARLASDVAAGARVDRLAVSGSELVIEDRLQARRFELRNLGLFARWPRNDSDLGLSASATWRGTPITLALAGLNPARLLSGEPDTVEIRAVGGGGRASLSGDLAWSDGLRFDGTMQAEAESVGALARWTGLGRDFAGLDQAVALRGECRIGPDGIEWPSITADVGQTRLEGTLALRTDGARPMLRGTLAGGDLDLDWILPVADPARIGLTQSDYDVRLSASGLRVGAFTLADVAAGILVTGDRLEVSLGRAGFAGGVMRGRVTATLEGESPDFRAHVSLERVDLATLLAQTGSARGPTGTLAGQATFEAAGREPADLRRALRGQASLVARDGEIPGVAFADAARRGEGRTQPSSGGDLRGGRTRYGHARLTVHLANDAAEIADGMLETPSSRTRFQGTLSLAQRSLAMTTWTRPLPENEGSKPDGRPPAVIEIRGPLRHLAVTAAVEPMPAEPAP